jgi:steroid 5-alpha reductase family enzyme
VDGKDWLWPVGPVANAWWSAVGTRVVYDGVSVGSALSTLVYPDKVLLGGITAWGTRLFYQVASRSVKSNSDDGRYLADKQEPGFWNKAFLKYFLPEAVVQAVISLPFTLSLHNPYAR